MVVVAMPVSNPKKKVLAPSQHCGTAHVNLFVVSDPIAANTARPKV